jgi:hypothetical protein
MMKYVWLGLASVVMLLSSDTIYATYTLTPSIFVAEEFNDNIELTKNNTKEDYITRVSPSIAMTYNPSKTLDVSLDYGLRFYFYGKHSELNQTSLKDTQRAKFKALISPSSRFFINITDTYSRVPIDVNRRIAPENVITNMTSSNTFQVSPNITVPLTSTMSTSAGYNFSSFIYSEDGGIDSEMHSAYVSISNKFTKNLTGAVQYNYSMYRPDSVDALGATDTYDLNQGRVSIVYQATQLFALTGELGESHYDFENKDNSEDLFWKAAINYNYGPTKDLSMSAGYSSLFNNSITVGLSESRLIDLNLNKGGEALNYAINPYYRVDKFTNINRKDRIAGVTVNVSRPISQLITIGFNGIFEKQKFLPEGKKVRWGSLSGNVSYQLTAKLLSNVGYRYSKRVSDEDDDFKNNSVWIGVTYTF